MCKAAWTSLVCYRQDLRQLVGVCQASQKSKIVIKITILPHVKIGNRRSGSCTTADFRNFSGLFFYENRNKIVKNCQNTKKLIFPQWQDFVVFKTHWFLKFEQILLLYIGQKTQNNYHFLKKCYFGRYIWFLIDILEAQRCTGSSMANIVK